MSKERNLAVRRGRLYGAVLCAVATVAAVAFVYGIWQGTYWALALPVSVAVLSALWLVFWIGWTIATVRGIPEEAEQYRGGGARVLAVLLCAATVAVAVLFLYGVAVRHYWALALPVLLAVLSLLGMVFWIGWAILMQKTTLAGDEAEHPASARPDVPPTRQEGEA